VHIHDWSASSACTIVWHPTIYTFLDRSELLDHLWPVSMPISLKG